MADTARLKIGDTVTMYNPVTACEHESWTRGVIRRTLSRCRNGCYAIHVVRITGFKWDRSATWGPHDGVPEVIAREVGGCDTELEFIDTWPRRG